MPNLTNYPAKLLPLPDRVSNFIQSLESEGFQVHTTNESRAPDGARHTLRVDWQGVYVGYMKHDMWKTGPLLGFRFNPAGEDAGNACPAGFDKESFSLEHGIESEALHIHANDGRTYLRVFDEAVALRLLRASAAEIAGHSLAGETPEVSEQDQVQQDIDDLQKRTDIQPTTKKRLVDARLGQGQYRRDLERIFGGRCAVTKIGLRQALRASHILPWKKSTDQERLDPDNGLLLTANLDALFDRHVITFDIQGLLRVSHRVDHADRQLLRDLCDLQRPPTPQQWAYLEQHNATFDKAEYDSPKR